MAAAHAMSGRTGGGFGGLAGATGPVKQGSFLVGARNLSKKGSKQKPMKKMRRVSSYNHFSVTPMKQAKDFKTSTFNLFTTAIPEHQRAFLEEMPPGPHVKEGPLIIQNRSGSTSTRQCAVTNNTICILVPGEHSEIFSVNYADFV